MKHIFEKKQSTQIVVDFTKSYKGNRDEIITAIGEIDLVEDMQAVSVKVLVENTDPNDKTRFSDRECSYYFVNDSSSFKNLIRSSFENIFNKIFDNTDNLDSLSITCTFNSLVYNGYLATKGHRNGFVRARLSVLKPTEHNTFQTIREYNIEIPFSETIIL